VLGKKETKGTKGTTIMHLLELDHFGLDVADLDRAERFYTEILGLTVAQRFGHHQVLLRCGSQMLALFERTPLPPRVTDRIDNPLGKGHHAFKVNSADFDTAQSLFHKRGVPTYGPIDWGDHDCLYFLDPDGNLLEIVAYRRLTMNDE
jgi:catechol 2,3-dioxygenase-like lactoylglutathione lyase family enzyme